MRNALAILVLPAIALAAPDFVTDFEPAALQESPAQNNETALEDGALELLKRQGGTSCANGWSSCQNINQPGICCRDDQYCSADTAGHAACCLSGAQCTGTIAPLGQATSSISVTSTTASTTGAFGTPTATTSTNPFEQNPSSAIRSTVPNSFYPFPIIPTTYTNAAACSSAYTSCQADASSCTAALANGAQGVTISAPNGGVTQTAVLSVGSVSAGSICASLSSEACSGLQVAACTSFDGQVPGAAPTRCAGVYRVGAGFALGIAGQLLR